MLCYILDVFTSVKTERCPLTPLQILKRIIYMGMIFSFYTIYLGGLMASCILLLLTRNAEGYERLI